MKIQMKGDLEILPCGGHKTKWEIEPTNVRGNPPQIAVIQEVCSHEGWLQRCETELRLPSPPDIFGYPTANECCRPRQIRECSPCCWYELLGIYSLRNGKYVTNPIVDGHIQTPVSQPGCTSRGVQRLLAQIRVFKLNDVGADIATFTEQFQFCQNGCVEKLTEAADSTKKRPDVWTKPGATLDLGGTLTVSEWSCCSGPDWQRVKATALSNGKVETVKDVHWPYGPLPAY